MTPRALIVLVAAMAASLVACIEATGPTGSDDPYDEGCTDGYDVGYFNGYSHGETCSAYDDDAGERFDTGGDGALYNQGYVDCYPNGYGDGYDEGELTTSC